MATYKKIIKLSKMEIQSGHNRVNQAENLICQLPETHDMRNSWLLNYGVQATAKELRNNDNEKRKEAGYSQRKLEWNDETECLSGIN